MDRKVTLSFDEKVIQQAKQYASDSNISLSRLMEFLLQKVTSSDYQSLEDMPVADWVNQLAEGEAIYKTRSRKASKKEFFDSQK